MTFCRRNSLATICLSLGVHLSDGSSAQDSIWREQAARQVRRAADARRTELIRMQYERRRSAAHARMRLEDVNGLNYPSLSPTKSQLSCPAVPFADTLGVFDRFIGRGDDGTLLINIGNSGYTGSGLRRRERPHPGGPTGWHRSTRFRAPGRTSPPRMLICCRRLAGTRSRL